MDDDWSSTKQKADRLPKDSAQLIRQCRCERDRDARQLAAIRASLERSEEFLRAYETQVQSASPVLPGPQEDSRSSSSADGPEQGGGEETLNSA
jgi:hypothetical protein